MPPKKRTMCFVLGAWTVSIDLDHGNERLKFTPKNKVQRSKTSLFLCRVFDRFDDVLIAGAAAEISLQAVPDLCARGIRIAIDDLTRGDDHSRRAVPALQAVLFPESFLDRMQVAVRSESFNRRYVAAVGLDGQHRAGLNGLSIEQNGAGAAD